MITIPKNISKHCDKENSSPKKVKSPKKLSTAKKFHTSNDFSIDLTKQAEKETKLFKHVVNQQQARRDDDNERNIKKNQKEELRYRVATFSLKYSHDMKDQTNQVEQNEIYSSKFTHDSQHYACGYDDGTIKLFQTNLGSQIAKVQDYRATLPITCLSFKPQRADEHNYTLMTSTLDGSLYSWRPKVDKELVLKYSNPKNQYSCMGISRTGEKIALGGKLPMVEIIDDLTDQKIQELKATTTKGHSNRIFCSKFYPLNHSMVYSGGWDKKVVLWDLRSGGITAEINGPLIGGDSVDMRSDGLSLVTGCNQVGGGIQIWDLRTLQCRMSFDWKSSSSLTENNIPIKYCKFLKPHQDVVIAGGPQGQFAKAFDAETGRQIHRFNKMTQSCLLSDSSDDGQSILFGYNDGSHAIYNVNYELK